MIARVLTEQGLYEIDVVAEEILGVDENASLEPQPVHDVTLPRLVAAAACGATRVAVVDARPPLLVSYDAGATWNESGRGLPTGFAVAIAEDDPDAMLFAGRNRLYLSHDGGRFWQPLALELPDIHAVAVAS